MVRLSGRIVALTVLFCSGVLLVALVFVATRSSSPAELFRNIVIRPIPRSVQNIEADVCYQSSRWDRLTGWDQHEYLLRFDISEEDLSKVLASDSFRELGFVRYNSDVLILGVTYRDGGHFDLYETKEKEPAWLDLGQWKDTKAWIAEEERNGSWYKARLVLYNEHLGKAYFYEHEATGEWEGTSRIVRLQD